MMGREVPELDRLRALRAWMLRSYWSVDVVDQVDEIRMALDRRIADAECALALRALRRCQQRRRRRSA